MPRPSLTRYDIIRSANPRDTRASPQGVVSLPRDDLVRVIRRPYLTIALERVTGIEPATTAWKAVVLPLHHTRIFLIVDLLNRPGRSRSTRRVLLLNLDSLGRKKQLLSLTMRFRFNSPLLNSVAGDKELHVGMEGFEPPASPSRRERADQTAPHSEYTIFCY